MNTETMAEQKANDNIDTDNPAELERLMANTERMQAHIQELTDALSRAVRVIEDTARKPNEKPMSRIKIPMPARFSGKATSDELFVTEWIFMCEQYMLAHGRDLEDPQIITFISMLLDDTAASWYLSFRRDVAQPSYVQFKTQFIAEFTDSILIKRARDKLRAMKQGKRSVQDYAREFRDTVRRIDNMHPADQIHYFRHGLHRAEVQREVDIRDPATLAEAITIADRYDVIIGRAPVSSGSSSAMDLDVVEMEEMKEIPLNAATYSRNKRYSARPSRPPRNKLTSEEREALRKFRGCFCCRRLNAGHFSSTCPERTPQRSGNGMDQ